jgi:hypothetical protein
MKCLNCLSCDAQVDKMKPANWFFSPIVLPVFCNRCITGYFVPTVAAVPHLFGKLLDLRHSVEQERPTA